jgi:chromosome partitioning protein
MSLVVSVLNQKGGSGKTTLATNLSRTFQLDGYTVEILDADPQRTTTEWARLQTEGSNMPTVSTTSASSIREDVAETSSELVVVDGAPALDTLNVRAVKVSSLVLIPVRASGPDVWSGEGLVDLIHAHHKTTGGKPQAAFVVCQQIARTNLSSEIGEVLDAYSLPVLDGRTNHRVAYAEALSSGTTVLDMKGATKAAEEVHQIASECLSLLDLH